jgi:hypothetical protein
MRRMSSSPRAHGRRDQPSHRLLEDEPAEQRALAVTVPLVFFGIAAFLLNVVLGRWWRRSANRSPP